MTSRYDRQKALVHPCGGRALGDGAVWIVHSERWDLSNMIHHGELAAAIRDKRPFAFSTSPPAFSAQIPPTGLLSLGHGELLAELLPHRLAGNDRGGLLRHLVEPVAERHQAVAEGRHLPIGHLLEQVRCSFARSVRFSRQHDKRASDLLSPCG